MDKKHAKKLRKLSRQGLCKIRLLGSEPQEITAIVHKNVPNNIAYEFSKTDTKVIRFLDRNKDHPAECYLYKSNLLGSTVFLDSDEYEEKCRQEDKELEKYTKLSV